MIKSIKNLFNTITGRIVLPTADNISQNSSYDISLLNQQYKISMILSRSAFDSLYPRAKPGTYDALISNFPKYEITTKERIASFISQCGHESAGFTATSENLNYSAKALNSVFGKYFIRAGRPAENYARKPEQIANIVYANRMGNGPTSSGDGWKYRGRGFIQLTGKSNYIKFSNCTGIDVVQDPDIITSDMNLCVLTALWYWESNNLNRFADARDIKGLTRAINGGYNGLDDRMNQYNRLMKIIKNK